MTAALPLRPLRPPPWVTAPHSASEISVEPAAFAAGAALGALDALVRAKAAFAGDC